MQVRTRSFGNPAGAPGGATSKRDPLPPPSYSEVEGLDLPDYRDLEFADESFKVGYENEEAVVRHTAEEYNEDKDIERGKNFPQSEESGGGGGVGLGRLSGCADERGEREDIVDEGRVRGSFLSDGDGGDGGGLGGVAYRNSRVFGDKFVTEFGESLILVRCSVKISVTILVVHQIW